MNPAIRQAIHKLRTECGLTSMQLEALVRFHVLGRSIRSIAQEFRICEGAVKRRLTRARIESIPTVYK